MASPQPPADAALAVIASYQQSTQRLRTQITAYLTAAWKALGTYRNAQMTAFSEQVVPVIGGAQQQMSALTAGYFSALRTARDGRNFQPAPVDPKRVTGAAVRNGTAPTEVYERPFHLVWRELHEGVDVQQAIDSGLDRAVQSALTDLQLAKTHTAQEILSADGEISGYRRVLEGAQSCGLCVVASTQRYHSDELMPLHPACDCSIEPLYGDTGQVIDEALLKSAHGLIQETFGISDAAARNPDYRKILVSHEHSELGPVLAVRGRPFRGPDDLKTAA